MNLLQYFRTHLAVRLVAYIIALILLLSIGYIFSQIGNAKSSSEKAIANYGMKLAQSYVNQMNTRPYADFLKDPQETEIYWSLRQELDDYRTRIGALYVYLVRIDEAQQPLLMIDGQPKNSDSASPINEVTDIPAEAVTRLLNGENASSPLIDNPQYGKYISTYAPIKDETGKLLGVLGIDTEVTVIDAIADSVIQDSIPYFIGFIGITLLATLLIVWFISRTLRPLRLIVSSAESIASGNLAEAGVLLQANPVRSADEIGQAYHAMVKMSKNLNQIIQGIASHVTAVADQLVLSTDQFNQKSKQLLHLNRNVEETVEQVKEGAETQYLSAKESARSMEDFSVAIQRVSEGSMNIFSASQQALEKAESGTVTIHEMRNQVQVIASVTHEANESVSVLNRYSQQIGEVLRSISQIANQTKLLALNASIEAARAGEHGSGFAVVAGEVRKLAEESSSATDQIASLLHNIQHESSSISEKMKVGEVEVKRGISLSEQTESYFHHVVDQFRFVTQQIQDLSAATEQMSAGSEEVSASADTISDIAKASSTRMQEVYQMTHIQLQAALQIAELADTLNDLTMNMKQALHQLKI